MTQKHSDYILFKEIVFKLLNNRKKNSKLDIQKIVNIKASINWGLNDILKLAFPNTVPVVRLISLIKKRIENSWLSGFATGESNFFIVTQKSKMNDSITVSLRFSISQHKRDVLLLENFFNFYNCGYIVKYEKRSVCEFIVTRIDDIVEHIIPFFNKYPVVGSKYLNYLNFKEAAFITKNKEHLNPKGLKKILLLKNNGKT